MRASVFDEPRRAQLSPELGGAAARQVDAAEMRRARQRRLLLLGDLHDGVRLGREAARRQREPRASRRRARRACRSAGAARTSPRPRPERPRFGRAFLAARGVGRARRRRRRPAPSRENRARTASCRARDHTSAKPPPPMPLDDGLVKPATSAAHTAASKALPPAASTRLASRVAPGLSVATRVARRGRRGAHVGHEGVEAGRHGQAQQREREPARCWSSGAAGLHHRLRRILTLSCHAGSGAV